MRMKRFAVKLRHIFRLFQKAVAKPLEYIKAQKETIYKALLLFLVLLFSWCTYEDYWVMLFNDSIMPYLHFSWNIASTCLYSLILLGFVYQLKKIYRHKYILSAFQMSFLSVFLIVYIFYRLRFFHLNGRIWGDFWYIDILVIGLIILLILVINNLVTSLISEPEVKVTNDFCLIPDRPITKAKYDILDYSMEVERLVGKLETLDLDKSWSIGITSPWGGGKTSFLNLIKEAVDRKKFIVVKFNPRNSKNAESIQEDFFSVICSALKPYNSCFSKMFKDYMEALQVLDDKNIINTILNLKGIVDKESEKEKLDMALRLLAKKVLVIIDDFDRLLAEEIIEVFKLIDGNASFPNLIFLTAYDKKHISAMIDEVYGNEATLFSDKFFNYEEVIPIRSYQKIYSYLEKLLFEELDEEDDVIEKYKSILNAHYHIVEKYLTTLRDVKRFLNLFIKDYKPVKKELNFEDYFLLTIIKYKDSGAHKKLYQRENLIQDFGIFRFKPQGDVKFSDVLETLFPARTIDFEPRNDYRRINDMQSFRNYFYNYVEGQLKLEIMESNFKAGFIKSKTFVDHLTNGSGISDFIEFLNQKDIFNFIDKNDFHTFVRTIFYLSVKYPDTIVYIIVLKLICKENVEDFCKKYNLTYIDYKNSISDILMNDNSVEYHHVIIQKIIINLCNNELEFDIIYTKDELLQINKKLLKKYIEQTPITNGLHIQLFCTCVKDIDQITRKVTIDEGSCLMMKSLILSSPEYYISTFVGLAIATFDVTRNSITCQPFWEQIFGGAQPFEEFIFKEELNELQGMRKVRNFWKLYSSNDYQPITVEGRGNVQAIIDDDLVILMPLLEKLIDIEKQFETLKNTYINENLQDSLRLCRNLREKINDNGFYIAKTGKLITKIDEWMREISTT